MGILNLSPDSFYDGGNNRTPFDIIKNTDKMLDQGAAIIDIGAASSRPGAMLIDPERELKRLIPAIELVVKNFKDAIISIDTYNAKTAREAINCGAHIINDISAGSIDPLMFETIADLNVPYIIMHMKGVPQTMQENPTYTDPIKEITFFFSQKIEQLKQLGVHDIFIDPGFGFGKTVNDNYKILHNLEYLKVIEVPIMVGLSRKSMISKVLGVAPQDALNGTTALNTIALQKGANILRVHDVKEAIEVIRIMEMFYQIDELGL